MPQELKAILKTAVETSWAREVAWLRTLVAFPSLRGQEAPCQDWIAGEFPGAVGLWTVTRLPTDGDTVAVSLRPIPPLIRTNRR
jgi:acetylornithine deacetylase